MSFIDIDLCLFGEGGAEGAATAAAETPEAAAQPEVVYGKQDDEPAQPEAPAEDPKPVDKKKAFEELINGEYKDAFTERTQKIINTRFKEAKALEAQRDALKPVLDALGVKYGIDPADADLPKKLQEAIDADDSYFEDEANRQGMTVQQLKEMRKTQRENAEFKQALEERQRQEARDNVFAEWMQQSETVKSIYPGFDFQQEVSGENAEKFLKLLQASVDVKTAYEVVHRDELMAGAIGYAVQTAQKRTVDDIRARGMRPKESGTGSSVASARVVKADPNTWTNDDIAEVARRVKAGEKIRL